jgi:sigma-B regulation protein RsbU (phosphoserine phosphatase)
MTMKNVMERLSARSIRLIYALVALVVLGVTSINFVDLMVYKSLGNDQCAWIPADSVGDRLTIRQIVPDGVTAKAGIQDGDVLVQIGGKPFKSAGEAQMRINAVRAEDYIAYTVERDGKMIDTNVQILRTFNVVYFAQFLYGFVFLLVGFVVVMSRPNGKTQRLFANYSILTLLFFGLASLNLNPQVDALWKVRLLGLSFIVASIFSLPVFIRFFLYFPVKRRLYDRKWFTALLYVASIVVVVLVVNIDGSNLPARLLGDAVAGFMKRNAGIIFNMRYVAYLAGLVGFIDSYVRFVKKERKRELKPILVGVLGGILTFAYVLIVSARNPFAIYLEPVILTPALFLLVVPVMFGYAIVRYRLMDMDFIVKRSLIYGMVTATMAALYLIIIYGIGTLLADVVGSENSRTMNLVALIVIAFAFDPIKRKMQDWIDRYFYQERYNYQKALLEFTQELPRQTRLKQILESMVHRIASTMHIEKVAVILCDDTEGCSVVSQNIDEGCCQFKPEHSGLLSLLRKTKSPQSFALLAEEPDNFTLLQSDKQNLMSAGVVLSVPMFLKDKLIGMINVGQKMSGKVYSKEDIDLLSTVAAQAAIAIENSRLHKTELEKEKFEEELSLARRIQQGLLPKENPSVKGLDVAGTSIPASTVGGDYFDFIEIAPHKLLVVIADVSGKGMSAALYMSKVQGMVQLAAHMYASPKEMLKNVNRRIFEGIERRSFITMILALFDTKKKRVRICRAGHNKALIGLNGKLKFLEGGGIGLGLERGPLFDNELEEINLPLKPDSLFFFYTDGLTEAMNRQGKEFGEETVSKLVKEKRSLAAEQLQRVVITAAEEFQGEAEQHDDVTIVVVKSEI